MVVVDWRKSLDTGKESAGPKRRTRSGPESAARERRFRLGPLARLPLRNSVSLFVAEMCNYGVIRTRLDVRAGNCIYKGCLLYTSTI
jgi:hypothetical protein